MFYLHQYGVFIGFSSYVFSGKGISLNIDQWKALKKLVKDIDEAVEEMN